MKKNLSIFVAIVVLAIVGSTLGYAAFPVKTEQVQTTATATNAQATTMVNAQADVMSQNISTPAAPAPDGGGKSQIIALILVLLVGGLGIHRFYLGYTWQGVVQLLTGGGCGIWALIDLIRIVTGDLGPKDGSYAKTL